ncbi:hypothetical protein MCEMSEM47_00774 [Burkholderiales bacterium]
MLWIACQFPACANSPTPDLIAPRSVRLSTEESFESVRLRMGQWALQFTPDVCLGQWPNSLLLEVSPSLKLWGGLQALLTRLAEGWLSLGWPKDPGVSMVWGPTPRAADWRVAWGAPAQAPLAELPLGYIPELHKHLTSLERMGLHTLGPLLRLPRTGLTRRLGPLTLQAIDAGLGRRPDLRTALQPPKVFEQSIELSQPSHDLPLLLEGCRRLLQGCVAWLNAQQCGLREAQFYFHHGHREQHLVRIGLADPSSQISRIQALLRQRLEHEQLPAAAHLISLQVRAIEPLALETLDFFGGAHRQSDQLRLLCERLQARLGDHQVLRIQLHDSHQPESASQLQPLQPAQTSRPSRPSVPISAQPPSALPPRPLWLLEAPLALPIRANQPYYEGPLRLRAGPERIETEWWTTPLRRDYFVAETQDQRLIWVFRNPEHQWFLHGLFG